MHEKKLLATFLLLGGLLVLSTSSSVGGMDGNSTPIEDPSVPQQAIDPYLEILSPSNGEVYYAADQYTHPMIILNYTWEGSESETFYNDYGWDATYDDLAVFMDEVYWGTPGIDEAKEVPMAPGAHNLTIIVGAFGSGYSNSTVTQSVFFEVEQTSTANTTYTVTITVTETITVQETVTATLTVTGTETQTEYVTETVTETTTVDGEGNPIALFKRKQTTTTATESSSTPGFVAIAIAITLAGIVFIRRGRKRLGMEA